MAAFQSQGQEISLSALAGLQMDAAQTDAHRHRRVFLHEATQQRLKGLAAQQTRGQRFARPGTTLASGDSRSNPRAIRARKTAPAPEALLWACGAALAVVLYSTGFIQLPLPGLLLQAVQGLATHDANQILAPVSPVLYSPQLALLVCTVVALGLRRAAGGVLLTVVIGLLAGLSSAVLSGGTAANWQSGLVGIVQALYAPLAGASMPYIAGLFLAAVVFQSRRVQRTPGKGLLKRVIAGWLQPNTQVPPFSLAGLAQGVRMLLITHVLGGAGAMAIRGVFGGAVATLFDDPTRLMSLLNVMLVSVVADGIVLGAFWLLGATLQRCFQGVSSRIANVLG